MSTTAFSPSPAVVAPVTIRVDGDICDVYVVDGNCASFLKDEQNTKLFKAIQRILHKAGMVSFYCSFITRNNKNSGLTFADICILQMMLLLKIPTGPDAEEALINASQEDYFGLPLLDTNLTFEGLCNTFICDWYWLRNVSPRLRCKDMYVNACIALVNYHGNYNPQYGSWKNRVCLKAAQELGKLGIPLKSLKISA